MLDPDQLRLYVIRPTLKRLKLYSPVAEDLLLGTAIAESVIGRRQFIRQKGGGPALSIYQIEPATARDLLGRFLSKKSQARLRPRVLALQNPNRNLRENLLQDLGFATALARLRYWSRPAPLPPAGDLEALARYWKKHYNTKHGAGTVREFMKKAGPYLV